MTEIAGDAADGTLVGSPWFIGKTDAASQKFVEAYKAKYNVEPDQFAAQAYDTLFIVAKAINEAGAAEPEKIKRRARQGEIYRRDGAVLVHGGPRSRRDVRRRCHRDARRQVSAVQLSDRLPGA